jgi:hypothetical protein
MTSLGPLDVEENQLWGLLVKPDASLVIGFAFSRSSGSENPSGSIGIGLREADFVTVDLSHRFRRGDWARAPVRIGLSPGTEGRLHSPPPESIPRSADVRESMRGSRAKMRTSRLATASAPTSGTAHTRALRTLPTFPLAWATSSGAAAWPWAPGGRRFRGPSAM